MSDAILTFQVQLSGVMETVLKSAMYEITQLVENSFLEEVARSKQEVESLKQRLQWSESRRREREGGGRVRCADCGRAGVPCEETENTHSGTQPGADESRGLKQEKVLEGAWSSCPGETSNVGPPSTPQEPATPSPITAPDMSSQMPIDMEGVRNESLLKEEEEETEKESTEDDMQGAVELSALGEIVSGQQWSPDMSEDTAPPAGHILPEQLSTRLSVGETGGLYMPESEHEHTARRVRLAGTPHSARLRNDLVLEHDVRKGIFQAGSDFTHENTDSEGLSAQPRMQPDSDCSSSSRALEPKPVTVYLDAVPIKQEVDSQADWDGDEEVYVPHRPLREVRGGRAPQPSAVTDHTSSRDLASCHGEFSEAECVTSQPRPQGRGSLVNHTQIRVTDSGATAAHSTAASHKGVCSLNSKAFMASKSIQGHPRAFPGERRLGSPHFGKSVTQLINVRSHLRQNMERTPHSCTQCGKTFSHLCHLKAHQQTHTGERPFCCTLCGRSFTKLSNLKAHRRVHTGERPYICTECGKRFTQKCNLKRHQRIHTAERLFSCK